MNIRSYIRSLISENYPIGAQYDSSAPWNSDLKFSTPTKANNSSYEVIGLNNEIAILQDTSRNKYLFYYDHLDRNDFSEYAEREVEDAYRDEDGDMSFEYSDNWEINSDVIQGYINDHTSTMKIGKGIEDYESGNFDIIEIDEPLSQEILRVFGKNNTSIQKALGVSDDLLEGVKDKEPFSKIIFGVDLSKVGNEDRYKIIQLIKQYKGEGIKTDSNGNWHTYVPVGDVEDFISDARMFDAKSTEDVEQFSKFKKLSKEIKVGDRIKFFDYESGEENPEIKTGIVKIIKPIKVLIDYPGSPNGEWIFRDKIDNDFFYHKEFGDVANKYTKVYFMADLDDATQDERMELMSLIKKFKGVSRHLRGAGKASGGQEYALLPADKFEEFYHEASKFEPYEGEMEKDVVREEEVICEIRRIVRNALKERYLKK